MHPNTAAALAEGRRRWLERMRTAKARAEIARFPNGRRKRGLPPLPRDKKLRKAMRLVENELAEMARRKRQLVPAERFEDLSRGRKLEKAADLGLIRAYEILQLGINPLDPKMTAIISNVALNLISRQIPIEAAAGMAPGNVGRGVVADLGRAERTLDRLGALLLGDDDGDE